MRIPVPNPFTARRRSRLAWPAVSVTLPPSTSASRGAAFPAPAAGLPASDAPRPPLLGVRTRSGLVMASWALTAVGVAILVVLAFEFLGTGLLYDRAQQTLLADFKVNLAKTAGTIPPAGTPVALVEVPRLGIVNQVVVQGTGTDDLKNGPGHYAGSPMPGEFGNALILGRRTTYGAPFANLDQLHTGDAITITTGSGVFTYQVASITRTGPGDSSELNGTLDSRLTLVTSDPAYVPSGRLAVVATLRGDPLDLPHANAIPVKANQLGLSGNWTDLAFAALWGILFVGAVVFTWLVARRWPPRVRYLLATPVLLTLFVLFCSSADGILPGML